MGRGKEWSKTESLHVPGTYTNREWTALRNHWSDSLSQDVKKFHRSLNKVYARRNLSGCSKQDKVNTAVMMHRGLSDNPDYRLATYDPALWKFYKCWLFLRNHPAFRFETTVVPSAVAASLHTATSTSSLTSNMFIIIHIILIICIIIHVIYFHILPCMFITLQT